MIVPPITGVKILHLLMTIVLQVILVANTSFIYAQISPQSAGQENNTSSDTDEWLLHWNHHNDILNYSEMSQDLLTHGYAIVPSNTTEWLLWWNHHNDLLNYSDIVFTGDITSKNITSVTSLYTVGHVTSSRSFLEGTEFATGPPYKKINYTVNLDQYTVSVDEFLKNPQRTNHMTIREPIIDPSWHSNPPDPRFSVGDHVLFYVKSLDGTGVYSQSSFKIPNTCSASDVLVQNPYARSDFVMEQDGVEADYNKSVQDTNHFAANKPIQFLYDEPSGTLSGKDNVIKYEIRNDDRYNGIVLTKEANISSKKCQWMGTAEWELSLKSGNYDSNIFVKNDDGTFRQTYSVAFSVLPEVTNSTSSIPPNAIKTPNGGWVTPIQTTDQNGKKLAIHYEVGTPVTGYADPGPPPDPIFMTDWRGNGDHFLTYHQILLRADVYPEYNATARHVEINMTSDTGFSYDDKERLAFEPGDNHMSQIIWQFIPTLAGNYTIEKFSDGVHTTSTVFSVSNSESVPNSPVLVPPLRQFKWGVLPENIQCGPDLVLFIRAEDDNSPACVKNGTLDSLVKRGWEMPVAIPSGIGLHGVSISVTATDSRSESLPELPLPTAWFKYIPICCSGNPWDGTGANSTTIPLPEQLKIKNYFKDHGITIIESMTTNFNCTYCPMMATGKPLYYSYYVLVPQADQNKMLNLGLERVDTIPSDAHPVGT